MHCTLYIALYSLYICPNLLQYPCTSVECGGLDKIAIYMSCTAVHKAPGAGLDSGADGALVKSFVSQQSKLVKAERNSPR